MVKDHIFGGVCTPRSQKLNHEIGDVCFLFSSLGQQTIQTLKLWAKCLAEPAILPEPPLHHLSPPLTAPFPSGAMPDVAIAEEAEAADVGEAAAAEGPPFRIKALLVSGKEAAPRMSGTFRTAFLPFCV